MLKRTALLFGLTATALANAGPACAQPLVAAYDVDKAVIKWMKDYGVANAEVAYFSKGLPIDSFAHGWEPSSLHPIGSLSKAITGLCIAALVDEKKLTLTDKLGSIFAAYFKTNPPMDAQFASITIEQLLTHKSGLDKNAVDDATNVTIEDAFKTAAQRHLRYPPNSIVSYSDTGYLILGYVAQTIAKENYESRCGSLLYLLKNAGPKAIIDPTLLPRAPNGGWDGTAMEYAQFLYYFDKQSNALGQVTRKWMDTRPGNAGYATGGKNHTPPYASCSRFAGNPLPSYGFGVCIRQTARGTQYYHDGLLHHGASSPPGHANFYTLTGGAFFFINEAGYAAVVIFSGENSGAAYKALEDAVIAAMTTNAAYVVPKPPPAGTVGNGGSEGKSNCDPGLPGQGHVRHTTKTGAGLPAPLQTTGQKPRC
jgi:hypothetical protein